MYGILQTKKHFPTDYLILIYRKYLPYRNDWDYQSQLQKKKKSKKKSCSYKLVAQSSLHIQELVEQGPIKSGTSDSWPMLMLSQIAGFFYSQTQPLLLLSLVTRDSSFLRLFRKSYFTLMEVVNWLRHLINNYWLLFMYEVLY